MSKLVYLIILAGLWIISCIPLPVLYLVSDILYVLCYYVIAYRKKVIFTNLRNVYPEKTVEELTAIAKQFYRNFCDFIIENSWIMFASEKNIRKLVHFKNGTFMDDIYRNGNGVVLLQGHFFNWELSLMLGPEGEKCRRYVIYKPLSSKVSEKLIFRIRSRFGTRMLAMHETKNFIKNNENKGTINELPSLYQFGADQSPMKHKAEYWTQFMNQDTAVFTGPEQLASQFGLPVVFLDLQKTGRGKYEIEYSLIEKNPAGATQYQITNDYIAKLEEAIAKNPSNWLWSHKRWKHSRVKGNP